MLVNTRILGRSGIYIKPSKRGTFTAAAKRHGKSVQGFASQVLANKGNYSPAMVKKANFARNASKWKHEDGGKLVPLNSLMPFREGGGIDDTEQLGRLIPSDYGYLEGTEGANPLGTISRNEYIKFRGDSTKVPKIRGRVNDAAWENILNEFASDPDLGGVDVANINLPYGSGDRIMGRYKTTPDELSPIPPEFSGIGTTAINVSGVQEPAQQGRSNKVNAYNYAKGRPYSKLGQIRRKLFRDGAVLPLLDQTVPQDTTDPRRLDLQRPAELEAMGIPLQMEDVTMGTVARDIFLDPGGFQREQNDLQRHFLEDNMRSFYQENPAGQDMFRKALGVKKRRGGRMKKGCGGKIRMT